MKPRYTLEQHKKLGKKIKQFRYDLTMMQVSLGNAYPHKLLVPSLNKLDYAFENLKCKLDDLVCNENKELPDKEVLSIYYGDPKKGTM